MFGKEGIQNFGYVPIPAQDLNDAAVKSAWVDLSKYGHATVFVSVGDTAGATFAVTLQEAKDNAATGAQTLAYTKYWSNGQKLFFTGRSAANFTVGETITQTGGSANTAYVYAVSSDHLLIIPLTNGTTWTTASVITGGTSGATATTNGTGQDEDIFLDRAASSTFTAPVVTFKSFSVEVDCEDLTAADDYTHFRVCIADPGTATIASGCIILTRPSYRGVPMPSAIGTQKIAATY